MASQGKKGKKSKGKTLNLTDFLATGATPTEDGNMVVVTAKTSWADEVEDEEARVSFGPKPGQQIVLPTAPRAARGPEIPDERIPREPPFTAFLANLPYDIDEAALEKFFSKLRLKGIRLPREGDEVTGRLKGYGYADFEDRQSLIDALDMNNQPIGNRQIRVDIGRNADNSGRRGGGPGGFRGGMDSGEDRTTGNWRSMGPRDPPSDYDRRDRDRGFNRGGFRFSNGYGGSGGFRGDDRSYDRNRGYDRGGFDRRDDRGFDRRDDRGGFDRRDDRGGFDRRDDRGFDRREDRGGFDRRDNRGFDRRDDRGFDRRDDRGFDRRDDRGFDRGGFDRRDDRGYGRDRYQGRSSGNRYERDQDEREAPRERPRLQLSKRSVPVEKTSEEKTPDAAPPTAIFGGAKPVDTSAKEREIEEKLKSTTLKDDRPKPVPATAIFGQAKPVDTTAKEREIEEKIKKKEEELLKAAEKEPSDSKDPPRMASSERQRISRGSTSSSQDRTERRGGPPDGRRGGPADNREGRRGGGSYQPRDYGRENGGRRDGPRRDNRDRRMQGGGERPPRRDYDHGNRRQEGRAERSSTPPMKKVEDEKPLNFAAANKFSFLADEDDNTGTSGHDSE